MNCNKKNKMQKGNIPKDSENPHLYNSTLFSEEYGHGLCLALNAPIFNEFYNYQIWFSEMKVVNHIIRNNNVNYIGSFS